LIYQDTSRKDYASLRIKPTWFAKEFVQGTGTIWLGIHMLPGINPDEVFYQNEKFFNKVIYDGKTVAIWKWDEPAIRSHLVGISFPQRGLTNVIKITKLDLLFKWFEEDQDARIIAGLIFLILFSILYFRFSGGTGCTLYVIFLAALCILFISKPKIHLISFIPLIILLVLNEQFLRKRKNKYLPPLVSVESGVIKRGLTAPEAAILLELPLNKVLTLTIFGMIKKGLLEILLPEPLTVKVAAPFQSASNNPKERILSRLKAARENGTVIHNYEEPFLDIIEKNSGIPLKDIDFTPAIKNIIENVVNRMKNFDLQATREYYKYIVKKAINEAKSVVNIPERVKVIDNNLDWILLGDDYNIFNYGGYHYRPSYWDRAYQNQGMGIHLPNNQSQIPGGKTSFKDVSASFAGWTENTIGSLANSISPKTLNLSGNKGFINLSGIDKVTGDVFESLSKGSSSGGFGGGCACACAGCACACACACGGR
jgi:hypothetical protein